MDRPTLVLPIPGRPQLPAYLVATGGWLLVAMFVALQNYLGARLDGATGSSGAGFGGRLALLGVWAAATPFVLWSVRRWPVRPATLLRGAAVHVGFGSLFAIVLNGFGAWWSLAQTGRPIDLGDWGRLTAVALVTWYHLALLVYLAIVAAGHYVRFPEATATPGALETATPSSASVGSPAEQAEEQEAAAPSDPVNGYLSRLAVRIHYRIHLVDVQTIDWIEAADDAVKLHVGDQVYSYRRTLKALEDRLNPAQFVRVHRSAMVNLARVREVQPYFHGDYILELKTGKQLRLSRTRRERFEVGLGQKL